MLIGCVGVDYATERTNVPMSPRIAAAAPSDRDAIIALLAEQFREHRIDLERESLAAAVEGLIANGGRGFILLARESGPPFGVACVSFTWTLEHGGRSAWLDELYVTPESRGRGTGKALLDEVLRRCRDAGCAAVDLEVDADHSRAANLYSREGFEPLPRRRWVKAL
ncbi:MAG: GNAT family N-acetyltransferase [Candidatus Binatia bacterium]